MGNSTSFQNDHISVVFDFQVYFSFYEMGNKLITDDNTVYYRDSHVWIWFMEHLICTIARIPLDMTEVATFLYEHIK